MIKLTSGHTITLESLSQEKTYANLLEGLPRAKFNDEIIERWRKEAVKSEHQRVVLINPVRRPGPTKFSTPGDDAAWGPIENLPQIVCVGMFQSSRPVRKQQAHFSLLNIVWFQDQFALPIDAGVMAQIAKLDWEHLAYNWTV
jgi:hypothetical protein